MVHDRKCARREARACVLSIQTVDPRFLEDHMPKNRCALGPLIAALLFVTF